MDKYKLKISDVHKKMREDFQNTYDDLLRKNYINETYSYNRLISDVSTFLAQDKYNTGANILVKEAQNIPIDIFLQVISTTINPDEKSEIVNNLISSFGNLISLEQEKKRFLVFKEI